MCNTTEYLEKIKKCKPIILQILSIFGLWSINYGTFEAFAIVFQMFIYPQLNTLVKTIVSKIVRRRLNYVIVTLGTVRNCTNKKLMVTLLTHFLI